MTTILSIEKWEKIIQKEKNIEPMPSILASWKHDRELLLKAFESERNIEWMKGYKDGMLAMKAVNEISKKE